MHQNIMKHYKVIKWVQLCLTIASAVLVFIILYANEELRKSLYTNKSLFIISCFIWALLLFSFLGLVYDFTKMSYFIKEEHELNKTAYLDKKTGLPNRNSFDAVYHQQNNQLLLHNTSCILMKISNLGSINDEYGQEAGDQAIQYFSSTLEEIGDRFGFVGRNGGNEFLAIIDDCDDDKITLFIDTIKEELNTNAIFRLLPVPLEISYTWATQLESQAKKFSELITYTYKKSQRG